MIYPYRFPEMQNPYWKKPEQVKEALFLLDVGELVCPYAQAVRTSLSLQERHTPHGVSPPTSQLYVSPMGTCFDRQYE